MSGQPIQSINKPSCVPVSQHSSASILGGPFSNIQPVRCSSGRLKTPRSASMAHATAPVLSKIKAEGLPKRKAAELPLAENVSGTEPKRTQLDHLLQSEFMPLLEMEQSRYIALQKELLQVRQQLLACTQELLASKVENTFLKEQVATLKNHKNEDKKAAGTLLQLQSSSPKLSS